MTFRLVFMGTPDFSVPSLNALIAAGHEVVCAYCQPPRKAGRGQKERPQPVHAAAAAADIPVRTPTSLKSADTQAAFAALEADVAVVAAYGLILPKAILDAPRLGCLNIHASLLPRWRGAAPIQRAIQAGDDKTGVTIMQMDEGLDTGPMLLRRSIEIGQATAGELHDALAELGSTMIVEALAGLDAGTLKTKAQPATRGVKYAPKIRKDEARIDWRQPAAELARARRDLVAPVMTGCAQRGPRVCHAPGKLRRLQVGGEARELRPHRDSFHAGQSRFPVTIEQGF